MTVELISATGAAARLSSSSFSARTELLVNDFRVVGWSVESTISIPTPSGWVAYTPVNVGGQRLLWFSKRITVNGNEPTLTWTFSATSDFGYICRNLRNVRSVNPVIGFNTPSSGSDTSIEFGSVPAEPGSMVLLLAADTLGLAATGSDAVGHQLNSPPDFFNGWVGPSSTSGSDRIVMMAAGQLNAATGELVGSSTRAAGWHASGMSVASATPPVLSTPGRRLLQAS